MVLHPDKKLRPGVIKFWLVALFFILTHVTLFAVPPATDPRERAILVKLFEATDGPSWRLNNGWTIDDPCVYPGWVYVGCTVDDTFVIFLILGGNNLSDEIPFELGFLRAILEISFEQNHLSGPIPTELSNLPELQLLNLSSNKLTGEIPDTLIELHSLIDGGMRISYNGLYTNTPDLDAYLDVKSQFDWSTTQTVPPANIEANTLADGTVELSWQLIEFTGYTGRYRIALSTQPGGPYEDVGSTPDKLTASFILSGLDPEITYYAVVYSETDPHPVNTNKVVSVPSPEIEIRATVQSEEFSIGAGLNGAWFNPETSGQGIFLEVFSNLGEIFVGWFTYDLQQETSESNAIVGHPGHRWLTAQGPFDGQTANLTVNLTRGGVFDNNSLVDTNAIGTMQLHFEDCSSASITYDLDTPAVSGEIPLSRIDQSSVDLCEMMTGQGNP